jgi:hypothetical protein
VEFVAKHVVVLEEIAEIVVWLELLLEAGMIALCGARHLPRETNDLLSLLVVPR